MSLRTLENDAPSLLHNRLPTHVQLAVLCLLALALMVIDARWHLTQPVRQVIATALYPLQQSLLQPLRWMVEGKGYWESLESAQSQAQEARRQMAAISLQARQSEILSEENRRLRALLGLRERLEPSALAAEVVYESPDSYTRRVIIDKGQLAGVEPGSPVLDERGILGQVTRVQPFTSEVRLLTDRDQAIPVQVARSGVRGVLYGNASNLHADRLELRFMPSNADIYDGDQLVTSGLDGVYPEGLPVAIVTAVERQSTTVFLRVEAQPSGRMKGARHAMVLTPLNMALAAQLPDLWSLRQDLANPEQKNRDDKSAQRRSTPPMPLQAADESTPAPATPTPDE
ncbi:MAG: rod shape-determining protein MreC [Comamonas sp.]|nr:rod shape-determining protein MreC [Comamonas sp.]